MEPSSASLCLRLSLNPSLYVSVPSPLPHPRHLPIPLLMNMIQWRVSWCSSDLVSSTVNCRCILPSIEFKFLVQCTRNPTTPQVHSLLSFPSDLLSLYQVYSISLLYLTWRFKTKGTEWSRGMCLTTTLKTTLNQCDTEMSMRMLHASTFS